MRQKHRRNIVDPAAQDVLDFWLGELTPEDWFKVDEALDTRIRDRWRPTWEEARDGGFREWTVAPQSCLALVILLDQFPRNMFRGSALAFASDRRALTVARAAVLAGHDRKIGLPERSFMYLPFEHSELLVDQDRSVRLLLLAFGKDHEFLKHARAHREIIRRFGRFPYRNAALGRDSTPEETAFLEAGGYAAMLKELAA
jgi:uncharacterized protein (DUF924 family)